jgi:hypothetical protein
VCESLDLDSRMARQAVLEIGFPLIVIEAEPRRKGRGFIQGGVMQEWSGDGVILVMIIDNLEEDDVQKISNERRESRSSTD